MSKLSRYDMQLTEMEVVSEKNIILSFAIKGLRQVP